MDIGLLAQSEKITGWLTPVWLISVGIAFGYIAVLLTKGLLAVLSRIPAINELNENPQLKVICGLLLTVVCSVVLFGYIYFSRTWSQLEDGRSQLLFLFFILLFGLILGFGFLALISKKRFAELANQPRGSFANWLTAISIGAIIFAVTGYFLAMFNGFGFVTFVDDPNSMFRSLSRLSQTGVVSHRVEIPANSSVAHPVSFYGQELRQFRFRSDQRVDFATQEISRELPRGNVLEMFPAREENEYLVYRKQDEDPRVPNQFIDKVYLKNRSSADATVLIDFATQVDQPQVAIIPKTAVSVLLLFLTYWIFCSLFPKVSAIAISTFKTEVSQPVFLLLAGIGIVFTVGSIYIPYNTFGEDIKMYKLSGLTLIRILGIFMAIWAASKSVAEEIEGRTALTVLSKPVGRRQFILGKFSGISLSIGLLFLIIGLWFIIWVAYKPIYDGGEMSSIDFSWQNGFNETMKTIPGLALAYLESLVFVAISIAISTRMGILANFMICFSIYVLGHLTPLIVQSAEVAQSFETVVVFGQFISVIFPVLDHFDIEPAIIGEVDVPLTYLGWATVYCLIYGSIAMLLSLVFFEDRDLA